jgi:hypothetical protein
MRRYLASLQTEPACLCRRCLASVARHAAVCDQPEKILALVRSEAKSVPALSAEDFYLDASGLMVFTTSYLLKRGYCCHSGCRHCPFPKTIPSPASNH